MITTKNLFHFSNEEHNEREAALNKAKGLIRSSIFKEYIESLNGKTPDQDYDRFLGLLNLINTYAGKFPNVKKKLAIVLSSDYLKGVDEEKIRDTVYDDLFGMYEVIKKGR